MFSTGLRTRIQPPRELAPCLAPLASFYLLLPFLQGEWNLQPFPKITSTLEEPTPHCPIRQTQSPASPTVVITTEAGAE